MKSSVLYTIISVIVVAAGGGIAFAAMSMDGAGPLTSLSQTNNEQTRTIEHAAGTTEITGVPKRIVVLEWTYAEDLLVLGVQPVGVADIAGMNKWVQMKEFSLSSDVVDVGTRQQPNLERISELDPDLIIGVQFRHEAIYDDLDAIASTILFNPYPSEEENLDHLAEMEQTFMTIADVIGKHDAGVAAIERMNDSFELAKQKISAIGRNEVFLVVQAYTNTDSDAAEMRIFTANSIPAQIMGRLGFENAWDVSYEPYGFSTVGLESLVDVDHANFFYVVQDDDNVFTNEWDNPVWQNLEFVKEDRTHSLGGDTWLFGGLVSAEIFADKVTVALAGDRDESKTISHAMGETTITGTPKRIVALDWSSSEILLHMGIQPVAVADLEGMKQFLRPEGLSPDIISVGTMQEPNLEVIAGLEPDLILAETFGQSAIYEELSSIAPTVMYSNALPLKGSPRHLESLEQNIILVADAVNERERGAEIVERLHTKYDEAAAKIEAAGLKGTKYVAGAVDPPYGEYTTSTLRFFDDSFFMSQMLSRMGLENA